MPDSAVPDSAGVDVPVVDVPGVAGADGAGVGVDGSAAAAPVPRTPQATATTTADANKRPTAEKGTRRRRVVGTRVYGDPVRDDAVSATGPRTGTALRWWGLWCVATAVLAYMGALNRAAWALAAVTALLAVVASWRWWLAWLEQRRCARLDALYRASGQAAVDEMAGVEFEHYVAAVLRGVGYTVEVTKASGDFGVDLIATRGGVRTAVQCKRQARAVNGSAIQQVVAGAAVYDCSATMVVSNHRYTPAAEHLAEVHDCTLVDRVRLARLSRARRSQPSQVSTNRSR